MPIKEFLTGQPGETQQLPRFNEQQQAFMNQLLEGLGGDLSSKPLEEQFTHNFYTNTLPTIAERFSAFGPGSRRSSAFQSSIGSAGAELNRGLAALRSQYGLQKAQLALQPTFENLYFPPTTGFIGGAAPSIGQGIGQGLGGALGAIGGGAGNLLEQFIQWIIGRIKGG